MFTRGLIIVMCLLAATSIATSALGDPDADRAAIIERLWRWTDAFNARDAAGICDLFAPDLIATVPDDLEGGRDALCAKLAALQARPGAAATHQRKGKGGRAGGDGEGTEDGCTADDCAAASGGLRGGTGRDGGGDDIFCLMSCSAACSAVMVWAICSCLAASCSKLRRTTVRSRVMGSSSCTNSLDVTAEAGAGF
jgi:hypothetical protein